MSHFAVLWKARTIEKYRQRYEDEKINSIILSNASVPEKTLLKRWKHYRNHMKKRLSRTFSKWYPEGTTVSNFVINFGDMKFPHILLRSAVGFLGGLILTYLCFVFFVFQLSISLINATVLSSFIGILLTLGLTLSNRMRCLVFLLIPQLFSRVGRYTLTCYALVLILTGPATNTLKNSEVLSESMACSQEQIKLNVRQINESVKKPFNSIKDALNLMIEKTKDIALKLKVALVKTNRSLITLASIIQLNFFWLDTVAKRCNAILGTPYELCKKAIKSSAEEYHKTSNDTSSFETLMDLAMAACAYLKSYDRFCVAPNYFETTFLATIKRKLKTFTDCIKSMLFIHIKIHHSYTFIGNTSRTPSQVAAGIVTEIRNRADPIFTWLSWSSCVTSLFLLLIIFRAKDYQHMYETRSRFDNRYITKEFRELDLKRQREGRDTVLPLNRRERAKYVTTTSFRLVASEKVYLNRSATFMMVTTFKLLIHIVADYSLYWVLMTIRHHGSQQTVLRPGIPETGIRVSGKGFVARFLKSIVETLNIPLISALPSRNICLPKPYRPDFNRYGQIGILIFLLWLFALFEPYGLRMRHLIMGHYRPERAKARAVWLYNHILRTRGSFMKFARRKLHREYKYSSYQNMTFRRWFLSRFPWLAYLFGIKVEEPKCLLCNITEESNDFTEFIRCAVPNCPGTYCDSCYADIGRMCTICMSPRDYGDLSDVSLEKGSSDEDSDDDSNNGKRGSFTSKNESEKLLDLEPNLGGDKSESDDRNSVYGTNHRGSYDSYLQHTGKNMNQATLKENLDDVNIECEPNSKKNNDINDKGMLDNYLITDCFLVTRKTVKLSQYPKMGLVTTAVFQCWYSFYQMNIINNQILVRRVGSLNKKIRCRKKGSKKTNTVLNGNDKITQNNNKGQNAERTQTSKSEKGNNTCQDNAVQTNENMRDNKKKKCKKKDNPTDVDSKSTSISFKYMKYIFVHLIPCTDLKSNTQNIPSSQQSPTLSVIKKKKKRKKSNASPKPSEFVKPNPEESRNYRIAAYLAELEWIKNKFVKKRFKKDTSLNIGMDEKTTEIDGAEQNDRHIKVYNVMIPKLKLNFSNDSVNKDEAEAKATPSYMDKLKHYALKSNEYAKIALDRYFKRQLTYNSVESTNSFHLSKDSVELANHNMEEYENQNNILSNNDVLRTMKYFDSMHKDLDCVERIKQDDDNTSFQFNSWSDLSISPNQVPMKDVTNKITEENKHKPDKKIIDIKESSEDSSTGWTRLKRVLSGTFPDFGFRGPLSIMKGLYSSLFIGSLSDKSRNSTKHSVKSKKALVEKGVLVCPSLCTCGCQKDLPSPNTKNCSIQLNHKYSYFKRNNKDIVVDATKSTCTCATQYYVANRDVGTFRNVIPNATRDSTSEPETSYRPDDKQTDSTSETETSLSLTTSETSGSMFTVRSETSKTDTTICSIVKVDYRDNRKPRHRRVKVITKANQSTLTDQTKVCDVSTLTDDWWSPIVEKKVTINARHNNEKIQRRDGSMSRELKNRGITAGGRIVKFKSHAQIIPREPVVVHEDILSPSRYLLESQKYYNELFSSKFYSPHVLTMAEIQHHRKSEKVSSKGRSHYRLSRKTRRLENCHSPRRMKHSDIH